MQQFALNELLAQHAGAGSRYLEFLRVPALSLGIYRLRAGEPDPQEPHREDEIYYVVEGRARFLGGTETIDVAPGTLLYVEPGEEHRFLDITEDLTLLVFFAPAEGSAAG